MIPNKDKDEVAQAKYMVQSVGVAYMDKKRNTLLHQCVSARYPLAVFVYANAGVPVNLQNTDGDTALHLAVKSGNLDLIRALYQCGANPSIRNKMGQTPIDYGNKQAKSMCEQFEPGLLSAIERGNFSALKRLLRLVCSLDTVIKDGRTGLDLARELSENGSRYHKCYYRAVIEHLYTVRLVHQVKVQEPEIVQKLVDSGKVNVNVRYKNHHGRTPLVCAIERNDVRIVNLLLSHGAAVNIRVYEDDESGPTAPLVHLVSRRTCPDDIVKAVITRASDCVTDKDPRGYTILHKAIVNNAELKTVEYLCTVHHHVLLYTRDAEGRLPKQIAQAMELNNVLQLIDQITRAVSMTTQIVMMVNFYGQKNFNFDDEKKIRMVALCEEKGRAQINAAVTGDVQKVVSLMTGDYRDEHGYTALIKAIACNRYDLVKAIINKKQRLKHIPDNSNRYPLHYAYALPDDIGCPFVQLLIASNHDHIEYLLDKNGRQPADYIGLRESVEVQDMLRQARATTHV